MLRIAIICAIGIWSWQALPWQGLLYAQAPGGLPKPIATRQQQFTIPFRIDPARRPEQEPTEVQLHASTDKGKTWKLQARVSPRAARFMVRVPSDGEYWFLVRTLDRAGRLRPERPTAPELRVVVDTTPPLMELKANRGVGNMLLIDYLVADSNIDQTTLKLQYRTGRDEPWQDASIKTNPLTRNNVIDGRVTLPEVATDREVEIRAEIRDLAGNPASHATVLPIAPQRTAPQVATQLPRVRPQDVKTAPNSSAGFANWPGKGSQRPLFLEAESEQIPGQKAAEPPSFVRGKRPVETIPTPDAEELPVGESSQAFVKVAADGNDENVESVGEEASGNRSGSIPSRSWFGGPEDVAPPAENVPSAPGMAPAAALAEQVINSLSFALDYDVDRIGGAGIAAVELWVTRDRGETWQSLGKDPDAESPIMATVPGDGLYGFRLVVQTAAGLSGRPPMEGDEPDFWIAVDRKRPQARITAAEVGASGNAGQLVIRWQAADANLAANPVTLLYGAGIDGPWKEIAPDLNHTGQYAWPINGDVPDEIYLRIEVRDLAGNVGVSETPEPISLDDARPRVRVRHIRPLRTSRAKPRSYHFFH